MIPVRVRMDTKPVLASDRVMTIASDHPLAREGVLCPACDRAFTLNNKAVLVFVGIDPEDHERHSGAYGTGGAVAVHAACAGLQDA